jgi:hypothetical protein
VRSLTLDGATATVDLSSRFLEQRREDSLRARLTQVVSTLSGKQGVTRVVLRVEGKAPPAIFPGVDVREPVSLATLRRPVGRAPKGTTKPRPTTTKADGDLRSVQTRLAALGYLLPSDVDGLKGPTTTAAVIAFQKWERLGRDGVVGPQTAARLRTAKRPVPASRGASSGRRTEVLLDRQLTLAIENGRVVRAFHVSTGAAATPTPPGDFRVYLQSKAWWSVPFRTYLPFASAFNEGIAFHEYPSVPVAPASHGCVRMVAGQAKWLYEFLRVGTPVRVLARS